MKTLVQVAIALASIPVNGYALSVLWGWFVVPLGVSRLGIAHALGVATLLSQFIRNKSIEKEESGVVRVAVLFMVPLVALGIGWIEHWFMVRP